MKNLISLPEARQQALKRFFTGKPCKIGHIAERMVSNRRCVTCLHAAKAEWDRANKLRRRADRLERDRLNAAVIVAKRAEDYQLNREKLLAKARKWRSSNPDKMKAACASWRARNLAYCKKLLADWRNSHPEAVRIYRRNRRTKLRGNGGSHTAGQIQALLIRQAYQCATAFCAADLDVNYHADHIIPLSRGGDNGIGNIQLLCPFCNMSKGALMPEEWLEKQKRIHGS